MTPDVHPKHRGGRYAAQSPLTPALWMAGTQANISAPMVPTFQINKICPFGRFLEKFSFTEHIKHEIKGFLVFSDSVFGPSARVRHGSGMEEGYFVNMDCVLEVIHIISYHCETNLLNISMHK